MTPEDVDALLQQLPPPAPSPGLRDRVLGEFGRRTVVHRPRRAVLALAVALALFAAVLWAILPKSPVAYPGGKGQDGKAADLKFAQAEWEIQSNGRATTKIAVSPRQLFVESADGTLTALDRISGRSEWTRRTADGSTSDWPPVTAQGVPEEMEDLEGRLRQVSVEIDAKLREVGPGPEVNALQKKRNNLRDRLRVAGFGDNVYLLSGQVLTAVDRKSGTVRWNNRLSFAPSGRPFAIRGYLFVPDAAEWRVQLLSVEKGGGEVQAYRIPVVPGLKPALGGPAYSDPNVYFVGPEGSLWCFKITDGTLTWSYATGPGRIGELTLGILKSAGSTVRMVHFSVGQKVVAIDGDGGNFIWDYDCGAPSAEAPVLVGNRLYVLTEKGELLALDAAPQKGMAKRLLWRAGECQRFLMAGRKVLYVLGVNREILAVDPASGVIVDRFPTGPFTQFHGSPEGRLYAVRPGSLVCFKERE